MPKARVYRSPRREQQAEQTRAQVLAAARRLFSERGYAATPISDVAHEAGVSVPTVYASVGAKPELALALVGFINDEVDMASLAGAQMAASTPLEILTAHARLTRVLNEQCGDIIRSLLSAAAASAEVAPAAAEGGRVHREGCLGVARRLEAMEALQGDMDGPKAGAVLATWTAPETVDRLVLEHGWTFDEVEAWLVESMPLLLLRPERRLS